MTTTTTTTTDGQLGHIVSWKVPASVSLDILRTALAQAGLSEDMAGDLHPRHVVSRALRDMKQGRVIAKLKQADKDAVTFQLTKQEIDAAEAYYYREALVTLNLVTGAVTADDHEIEERARALVAEHTAKRMTGDLTRLVQSIYDTCKADLMPIREQGGAYFVPDAHSATVDQSRTLLRQIGGRLNSFAVRLGSADTNESVAESIADYMARLIEEFRESCADLSADSRSDVAPRRQARMAEIRQKLECYRGILGATADAIGQSIASAEQDMLKKLMETAAQ